ncbi:SMI1/KNR4 family protein [Dactylosporangium sp. CA-139066]|uniref:SMI1/KNR4 family protein n=1 Tax=Dactylosporangium sp. CA-139066 TaxID=3239930 RepID=UPI003D8CFC78
MAIEELTRLVPTPARPVEAGGDWARVEAELGLTLPGDFKELLRTYGNGQFVDHVSLLPAVGPDPRLLVRARSFGERERTTVERYPDLVPEGFHPAPGGLLGWAADDDGVSYCWSTGAWRVVIWDNRNRRVERFDTDATGFLARWLSGALRPRSITTPPAVAPWFQPFRDRRHAYVVLSDSDLPYEERLRVLKDALAPVQERGSTLEDDEAEDEDPDEDRQDFFAAVERDWIITYETSYNHQIRFAYPPEDDDGVRALATAVAPAMGSRIVRTTDQRGAPIWS